MKKYIIALGILSLVIISSTALADNGQDNRGNGNESMSQLVRDTGSTLEVHVYDNGRVLVRGAKVTSVSGTAIAASTTFDGGASIAWNINANANNVMTEFFDHDSRTVAVTQIQAGDYISFSGIMNTASAFTVNAAVIKDWSAQIKSTLLGMRTFEGSLQSVSATSLPVTLTMMIDNMSFTVNVPADISILDKNWAVTPISNFQAGDTVRIYGAIEAANTSVIDATVVRNASR